jgi:hypothetical protein
MDYELTDYPVDLYTAIKMYLDAVEARRAAQQKTPQQQRQLEKRDK